MKWLFQLAIGGFFTGFVQAQPKTSPWLEQLIRRQASPLLLDVLDKPDSFQYQLIYTQIDRDKDNRPHFTHYYLHVDRDRYFNPASTVKMPVAFCALEKLHEINVPGLNRNTPMLTDSSYSGQVSVTRDSLSASGLPSIAQYIKEIFLVSDNDAYNRLYEFVGQETLNKKLLEKGYAGSRITRRFMPMSEEENRHTNRIRFVQDGQTVYEQPPAYSTLTFDYSKKHLVGRAHLDRRDSLINEPMDFTTHNVLPLEDLQQLLQSVLFPRSVPERQRFRLTDDDYRFLYRYMSELPRESRYPHYDTTEYFDSYAKFFLFKAGKSKLPPYIRVFNKPGWTYGFLTDVAYIVDFKNKMEFMLTGCIYANSDGVLNDDKYDYDSIGYPFFKETGRIIYDYELKRPRKYAPNLDRFKLDYRDSAEKKPAETSAWIRINLLGYLPGDSKAAVWCSKSAQAVTDFEVADVNTGKPVYKGKASHPFGAWGPFAQTCRLDFSSLTREGRYTIRAGGASSPQFRIAINAYDGAADFCLRYMRQQRSGFNPFLKDSCHTRDGYTMYGPMPDSTHIDVAGGWHDASDYLQYASTSANAAWHLLAAYRDFPEVFADTRQANGLEGKNGRADVLDEAKWGLDWLLKMHPRDDWMFHQLADDRDHQGMRIPGLDSFYGKGYERPVYFLTGEPQGLGKYKNRTTGTTSTAAKFASAFALGNQLFLSADTAYAGQLYRRALTARHFALLKPGVTQTAPNRAPYFYEEENWRDDEELMDAEMAQMELANHRVTRGDQFDYLIYNRNREKITPWLGRDTARHYQWYPFINLGHYEFIRLGKTWKIPGPQPYAETLQWYKQGIERVWQKARHNAFYRGVPFIWCSNNLTTAFAIQCDWYRRLSGDPQFRALEQANIDWLFGCNPWGTSFVYGLPADGDTPTDPHSAFTHLKHYPIDGGLVDGPVYGSIYKQLKGITLYKPDAYAPFQSDLVVYHDDYGDYSTNEPTMDGTASLIYLLAARQAQGGVAIDNRMVRFTRGAVTRGDSTARKLALVFTGDEFAEGGNSIIETLNREKVKASFFFTGRFYRNPAFKTIIQRLRAAGHYLGPHSDGHLLYCDWNRRDSLLVSREQFTRDLQQNYAAMRRFGIQQKEARFFLPPYEWYNDSIAAWTRQLGLQLLCYTPGTVSHADYTTDGSKAYRGSEEIFQSVTGYEQSRPGGLNGFILLLHIGAGPGRTDKFYRRLPALLKYLKERHYELVTVPGLLR